MCVCLHVACVCKFSRLLVCVWLYLCFLCVVLVCTSVVCTMHGYESVSTYVHRRARVSAGGDVMIWGIINRLATIVVMVQCDLLVGAGLHLIGGLIWMCQHTCCLSAPSPHHCEHSCVRRVVAMGLMQL